MNLPASANSGATLELVLVGRFVYGATMHVTPDADLAVSRIAALIGEPTRARILFSLLDGRMRTGAELAAVAGVSPSTTSVHLSRLESAHLIEVHRDGKHCYYGLPGVEVARALKAFSALATPADDKVAIPDSHDLLAGRRCYDHMAGDIGTALHDGFMASSWLTVRRGGRAGEYELTPKGTAGFASLGIDLLALRGLRRRFAYGCPDWQEGKFHLGGALGAALARVSLDRSWVTQAGGGRVIRLSELGRRDLLGPVTATAP